MDTSGDGLGRMEEGQIASRWVLLGCGRCVVRLTMIHRLEK